MNPATAGRLAEKAQVNYNQVQSAFAMVRWGYLSAEENPPFGHAPFMALLNKLNFQTSKYFWIDDVFVTGYLRDQLNISLVDTQKYQTYSPAEMLKIKSNLNQNQYHRDYINTLLWSRGPNQKKVSNFKDCIYQELYHFRCTSCLTCIHGSVSTESV